MALYPVFVLCGCGLVCGALCWLLCSTYTTHSMNYIFKKHLKTFTNLVKQHIFGFKKRILIIWV